MSMDPQNSLTAIELADALGITPQALHKYCKQNSLEGSVNRRKYYLPPEMVRRLAELRGLPRKKGIFATHLVKGGVGKTTLTSAVATRASAYGHKVLMIDLDQQGNLGASIGYVAKLKQNPTLFDLYLGTFNGNRLQAKDVVVPLNPFLHLIPANLHNAGLDIAIIQNSDNLGTLLHRLLAPIAGDYDLIFLDCPPSLSPVTRAACLYAGHIVLPITPDQFALDGLDYTVEHLVKLYEKFPHEPELHIVINKFDARSKLSFGVLDSIQKNYSDALCESYIGINKDIDNAHAQRVNIWGYSTRKTVIKEDIDNLVRELLDLASWKQSAITSQGKQTTALATPPPMMSSESTEGETGGTHAR